MRCLEGALATLLLAGCVGYRAGDLRGGDPMAERGTECLDLRVSPYRDAEVDRRGWLAVRYELGNHCRAAIEVDLGRARVTRLADGMTMSPRGQATVRPVLLDAGGMGGEILAYAASDARDYCVDLGGVAPGTDRLQPVCFSTPHDTEKKEQ